MKCTLKSMMLLSMMILFSCSKDPYPGKVEIVEVTDVTHNSMVVKASISGTGEGAGLQVKGVCFDKTGMPEADRDCFEGTTPPGPLQEWFAGISGLEPDTRYIIRAYCETNVGMVYSDTMIIRTTPVEYMTDPRDGKEYEVKQYGNHLWMLRNLDHVTPGSLVFENKDSNGALFGRLYPYAEALSACPPGWRLPTDEEWKALEQFIGVLPEDLDKTAQRGSPYGGMMKEPGMRLWESSNALNSNNHSGFSIVPSGWYNNRTQKFSYPNFCAQFWANAGDSENSSTRSFYSHSDAIGRLRSKVNDYRLSVRCIK